ncbi:30S ribosomal protein S14 [Kineosporia sp. J2-2]|uniref:Small ribosomal subunit protein uS14 n=1 Tax=Kineosporia corallincola TaxID=2835133 RepID=A0ABS5TD55_9ACTN|nr:30S ribosomal protein S14 [Kineosporia corallincola]MBT0769020.1 30S ribosomal protein S14 [Kineosporia corallincola]
MAKKSKIARDAQRREVVDRYAERRLELKRLSVNPHVGEAERAEAMAALHRLPRNASPTRLRNRDVVDGRPRGHLGRFGLSRVRFREMAHRGELPGITKSSW